MQQLPRIVPLVDRVREVDALIALEADQPRAQHLGHDLGRLGLANARLALDEERLLQLEREKDGRRQGAVADVAALAQTALDVLDGRGCAHADKGYEVVRPSTRIVRTNRPAARSEPRIVRTIREGGPAWSAGPGHPETLLALRLLNRPLGEHAGEVLFVFRAGAQVAAWVEPVRRVLGRLLWLGALLERLFHGGGPDRRDPDVGEADP